MILIAAGSVKDLRDLFSKRKARYLKYTKNIINKIN